MGTVYVCVLAVWCVCVCTLVFAWSRASVCVSWVQCGRVYVCDRWVCVHFLFAWACLGCVCVCVYVSSCSLVFCVGVLMCTLMLVLCVYVGVCVEGCITGVRVCVRKCVWVF